MSTVVFPDPVKDYLECAALCANGRECQNHGRYVFRHRLLGEQYLCRMHYRSACNKPLRPTDKEGSTTHEGKPTEDAMQKITATQQKALDVIADRGALYLGNEHGISFSTVRRLAALGLVRLETSIAWTRPALSVTASRSYRDWVAYPAN